MISKIKENLAQVEKFLILLIIASVIVMFFIKGGDNPGAYILPSIFLQLVLLLVYIITTGKKSDKLFLSGFFLYQTGNLLNYFSLEFGNYLIWIGLAAYASFGIMIIIRAVKESMQYGGFELLTFLLGFLLLVPAGFVFIRPDENMQLFFSFALAFIIGTIMYNDNLWEKFSEGEKKIITYLLISVGVIILSMSFKHL